MPGSQGRHRTLHGRSGLRAPPPRPLLQAWNQDAVQGCQFLRAGEVFPTAWFGPGSNWLQWDNQGPAVTPHFLS